MASRERQDHSLSPASKRKLKGDDANENPNGKKRVRTRVSYSCSECHRRKQKCDRQSPCGHCVARKVPELCHAYQPGKGEGDLHLRLARVEQILELALPQFSGTSSPGSADHGHSHRHHREMSILSSPDDSNREDDLPNGGAGTLQSGRWFGASAVGSVSSAPILEQLHHERDSPLVEEIAAAEKLKGLTQDYGVPPHKLAELVQDLPPKALSDVLIDYFFTSINWTRYPIYEPQFRSSYDAVWANGVRVHPLDVRFLPLLFIVLAIAARLAPENVVGDDRQRRLTSLRYYWSSRRSMLIAAAVGEAIDLVLARLMTSRFLTFDRRLTECWTILGTAVRTALALGLHRDGAKLGGLDPFQIEHRRRIWAYLSHADRTHSLILGRPPSLHDEYSDTLPPTNIEDDTILANPDSPCEGLPLSQPTRMTFVILRARLGKIIGKIVRHFQQVKPTHYSDVIALDEELQQFIESLPPHYSVDPDTSLDSSLNFVPVHRYLITTEVFFVRISLHRPYMLRKLDSNRFAFSRNACYESAKKDFEIRQAFKHTASPDVIKCLGGAYREFQSAMISGISLAIDPHGPEAPAMHKILDTFVSDCQSSQEKDETTRRELKIIELLKSKSLSASARQADSSSQEPEEDESSTEHGRLSALRTRVSGPREDASMLLELGHQPRQPLTPLSEPRRAHPPIPYDSYGGESSTMSGGGLSSWSHPHSQTLHTQLPGLTPPENLSPSTTEDESAQKLLDNWINNAQIDSVGVDNMATSGWTSLGLEGDIPMDMGRPETFSTSAVIQHGNDPSIGDWNYWETLVEHIRASGGLG